MFRIGETDFGINGAKSSVSLRRKEGVVTIVAEIHGDEGEHQRVSDGESSPWFWTLYPPYFYLREFPVAVEGRGAFTARVTMEDLEDYDVAIYLMEHFDVDEVSIRVQGSLFTAEGIVLLSEKPLPFSIRFSMPGGEVTVR